jgi:CDP-diacylglycerol--glycerol-3-phosphate 3-phosphatidyltransferase
VLCLYGAQWSFHAKGLWADVPAGGGDGGSSVSMIGSTNYGSRSLAKDVECQFALVTRVPELRARMAQVPATRHGHTHGCD